MKLFRKRSTSPGLIAPDAPFTAIGDIHGRDDLLKLALSQAKEQVVCVGDYIDRGPDSAAVLRRLQARPDIICLMGNHEEMMLDFLSAPNAHGPRWLRYGGAETLTSFGIMVEGELDLTGLSVALRAAMGSELITWVENLPSFWRSGNLVVVHAAADPTRRIEEQTAKTLRWGHAKFGQSPRCDRLWILRGHVIVDEPIAMDGIISVDTGAHATGRLSLAHVRQGGVDFSEASARV